MGTKVLLVGVNAYPTMPLKGCINDVENMRTLLQQRHNIVDDDMRVLRDEQATKAAIEDGIRWLGAPNGNGDAAVRLFHFSGHGTFVVDEDGDEPDGRDEALVPYDYDTVGAMTDDALRSLYASFGGDTHLLLTMDCCHSGSIQRRISADVRYRFFPNSYADERRFDEAAQQVADKRDAYVLAQLRDLQGRSVTDDEWERRVKGAMARFDKKHFGLDKVQGNVVLLSACRADQTAADAHLGDNYNGAFTYYLAQVLSAAGNQIEYGTLIEQVGQRLYESDFLQVPQLECSTQNRACSFLNMAL